MSSLRELYLSRRVLLMAPLGFSSGLPLLLTGGTLSAWAYDARLSLTEIGFLASIATVYAFKFIWAPVLDRFAPPLLDRRRGWLIMFQLALMVGICAMALIDPAANFTMLAILAGLIALFSASQDIVADAYRIDVLSDAQRGSGTGLFVGGYRLGMVVAGGLTFYLADPDGAGLSWQAVYALMGLLISVGIVATILAPSSAAPVDASHPTGGPASMAESITGALRQLLSRKGALAMLLFIMFFKLPDVLGNNFTVPFLKDMGVSDTDIGVIRNSYGLALTIVGALAGAWVVARLGLKRSLLLFGILQAVSNCGYLWLANFSVSRISLLSVISIENLCGGQRDRIDVDRSRPRR